MHAAQVLYSAYLHSGPWMAAEFAAGEPPGLFFMSSVLFRRQGAWATRANPDTLRVGLVHMATFVLPATLWTASVVLRWCVWPLRLPTCSDSCIFSITRLPSGSKLTENYDFPLRTFFALLNESVCCIAAPVGLPSG